jgi:hypothetical protein
MADAVNVSWTYESYWALCWALGLINKMGFPKDVCNTKIAISFVSICNSYNDFKKKVKLRDVEEILDMLDLYYRYHWATVENSMTGTTEIKDLNLGCYGFADSSVRYDGNNKTGTGFEPDKPYYINMRFK